MKDNKEDRMFTAWLLHDSNGCVRCRARIMLYYEWHYAINKLKVTA